MRELAHCDLFDIHCVQLRSKVEVVNEHHNVDRDIDIATGHYDRLD